MTTSIPLICTWALSGRGSGRVVVTGDLDYVHADEVNRVLRAGMADHPGLHDVHIDCAGIDFCDSYGLSVLIIARRLVTAAGARLHLDGIQPRLERVLQVTGTLEYLTADPHTPAREERLDP